MSAALACAPTSSSGPTARTGSWPALSRRAKGSSAASRWKGTYRCEALAADLERTAVIELAHRAGRVRLGLPEGRSRESRRRRLGERGAAAPRPPRDTRPGARGRSRCGDRRARPSAPDAEAGHACRARARAPRRRRSRARRPPLGRRDVRGLRLRAARRGGDPRRRPRRATRRRSQPRSTAMPPLRGPPSEPSTAIPERSSRPRARRGCSASSPACSAERSRIPRMRAGSRARR